MSISSFSLAQKMRSGSNPLFLKPSSIVHLAKPFRSNSDLGKCLSPARPSSAPSTLGTGTLVTTLSPQIRPTATIPFSETPEGPMLKHLREASNRVREVRKIENRGQKSPTPTRQPARTLPSKHPSTSSSTPYFGLLISAKLERNRRVPPEM